jgi:ribosomal protein S27AE
MKHETKKKILEKTVEIKLSNELRKVCRKCGKVFCPDEMDRLVCEPCVNFALENEYPK